ncbi:hypothetical protein B296_00018776 [Ensete ventricosum]|uniref:Uncharacterized protein n=1 Tax=Ensete ventricosum TaxID=4639 RepID=A0A426YK77_ENSVE|nr:hypothetical protein B296_00018776 [Ensete ventricosum]
MVFTPSLHLESTALLAVALFTEMELPAASDHSHDHRPPSPLDYFVLLNNLHLGLPPQMHLLDYDPSPIQSPLHPSSAYKTYSYLQVKIGHKVNQIRAAKPTASPLLAVQAFFVALQDSAISYLDVKPTTIFILEHQSGSNLIVHKVVGAPRLDENGDRPFLKKSFNFHYLRVRIAGWSMSHVIGLLQALLRVLLMLEVLLFMFRFFNGFDHEKSPLFAMMVTAPQLIVMSA